MIHTEQDAMTDFIDALPFIEPYGYWDNTDPADDVSAEEWTQRAKDWEVAIPSGQTPSARCLTLSMFDDLYPMPPKPKLIAKVMPSRSRRINALARKQHIDEAYRAILAERHAVNPNFEPAGFELFFQAQSRANDDVDRRAEIKAEIDPIIRDLTYADLNG